MGGRGSSSKHSKQQLTIEDIERQFDVSVIVKDRTILREAMSNNSGALYFPELLKKCACCMEYSIPIGTKFEICPNCGWIDDPYQTKHPTSSKGRNAISLIEAQKIYQRSKNHERQDVP